MRMMKVDDETYENICKLAESHHVSRASLISEAVVARVEHDEWERKAIGQAMAQVEVGDVVSNKDAINHIDSIINGLKKKVAGESWVVKVCLA
ncbi:MAG: hypothetical protein Q9M14_01995 [Mariprofundaceae bacterium]|nr:hypothetical protein [Mariprofundaceae bacterium]